MSAGRGTRRLFVFFFFDRPDGAGMGECVNALWMDSALGPFLFYFRWIGYLDGWMVGME